MFIYTWRDILVAIVVVGCVLYIAGSIVVGKLKRKVHK